MGLQLRNKSPNRRVKAKLRGDRSPAVEPNQIWAMDFVHDQLFDGKKIHVLTVVDVFTRFSPAIDARFAYKGVSIHLSNSSSYRNPVIGPGTDSGKPSI